MNRHEIEIELSRARASQIEEFGTLAADVLAAPITPSDSDPASMWTPLDHLVHVAGFEQEFAAIVRRFLAGDADPVALLTDRDGNPRTREQIFAIVNEQNERYVAAHRCRLLDEAVALGQAARADTLTLLSELTDDQLQQKVPGAPWGSGLVGGILGATADHGRMHWKQLQEALGVPAAG